MRPASRRRTTRCPPRCAGTRRRSRSASPCRTRWGGGAGRGAARRAGGVRNAHGRPATQLSPLSLARAYLSVHRPIRRHTRAPRVAFRHRARPVVVEPQGGRAAPPGARQKEEAEAAAARPAARRWHANPPPSARSSAPPRPRGRWGDSGGTRVGRGGAGGGQLVGRQAQSGRRPALARARRRAPRLRDRPSGGRATRPHRGAEGRGGSGLARGLRRCGGAYCPTLNRGTSSRCHCSRRPASDRRPQKVLRGEGGRGSRNVAAPWRQGPSLQQPAPRHRRTQHYGVFQSGCARAAA